MINKLVRVFKQQVNDGLPVRIGVEADNEVLQLIFTGLPDLDDFQQVSLRWSAESISGEEETPGDIIVLSYSETGHTWSVPNTITQYAGRSISAYLRITTTTGPVWSSESFSLVLTSLPDVLVNASPMTITAIDELLAAILQHNLDMAGVLSAGQTSMTDLLNTAQGSMADIISQAQAAIDGVLASAQQVLVATQTALGEAEDARDDADTDAQATAADRLVVADDKAATHGYMERAETGAVEAEAQADEAERQAGIALNNILNGVSTHNVGTATHEDIRQDIRTVEALARGRATSYVFDTRLQVDDWLAGTYERPDGITPDDLIIGDNIYIKALSTKDQWWTGEGISPLESEAPDLADYYTKAQVDALLPIYLSESELAALVAAGTVEAGRVYYPVPDDQWEGE